MKRFFFILLLIGTLIFPTQEIGLDSGLKSIILFSNDQKSSTALVFLGGIHGDEIESIDVVNYLYKNLESEIALYFIPSLNPTLSSIEVEDGKYKIYEGRRGYLEESLDKNGYTIPGKDLSKFNKDLYYRIFYGSDSAYKNGIKHYVDPNRDFNNERLPSTRAFKGFIQELQENHDSIIILSIHAYMRGGRIYPEYIIQDEDVLVLPDIIKIAKGFSRDSGYIYRDFYEPALPIKDRFKGELIEFYSSSTSVTAFDIELDSINKENNSRRVLNGVKGIIELLQQQ